MARNQKEYGPVITCGAAAVSFSANSNEPTSIEWLVRAVKRFMTTERSVSPAPARQNRLA